MKTKINSNSELFALIFSMSKSFNKNNKRLGNSISRTYLLTLKKVTVKKKDKTIQEYARLLKLTKQEYQKLFQEKKYIKGKNKLEWKRKKCKKNCKKTQYKVETDSKEEEEQEGKNKQKVNQKKLGRTH